MEIEKIDWTVCQRVLMQSRQCYDCKIYRQCKVPDKEASRPKPDDSRLLTEHERQTVEKIFKKIERLSAEYHKDNSPWHYCPNCDSSIIGVSDRDLQSLISKYLKEA